MMYGCLIGRMAQCLCRRDDTAPPCEAAMFAARANHSVRPKYAVEAQFEPNKCPECIGLSLTTSLKIVIRLGAEEIIYLTIGYEADQFQHSPA